MAWCNRLRLVVMFSLPSGVLSRDDDDLVRDSVGSLYRGETGARFLRCCRHARFMKSVAVTESRGDLSPWASALAGHGHKIIQARTGDVVQEALTFHAGKGKRLPPD
jgi:hypothetical protein